MLHLQHAVGGFFHQNSPINCLYKTCWEDIAVNQRQSEHVAKTAPAQQVEDVIKTLTFGDIM